MRHKLGNTKVNQIKRRKAISFTLLFTILLISTAALATAQNPYSAPVVTNITINNSGSFTAAEADIGIIYQITGTPGSTGTVTAQVYNGNPQVTADIPDGITLTKFIVVTFDFDPEDFMQATLTFSYTDADIAGIKEPFVIYKYIAEADLYVQIDSVVDSTAKTITIILNSTEDPLFGIGGTTDNAATNEASSMIWIAVAVAVIIIVVAVFLVVKRYMQ
jgi:hypothetical protein